MRYRTSPLDVRREYVKIQKSILRPLLMAKVGFCVKIYVSENGQSKFEV